MKANIIFTVHFVTSLINQFVIYVRDMMANIIFIVVVVAIAFGMSFVPQGSYYYISLKDMIPIFIGFWLSYIYSISKSKRKMRFNFVEQNILSIIKIIENMNHVINTKEAYHRIMVQYRNIKNTLTILKSHAKYFNFKSQINYCENNLNDYWKTVSENPFDYEGIRLKSVELDAKLQLISTKLKEVLSDLYKK
ncbi:hypothetical protein [Veillonella magna]|uniref:SMODS and SLOG-associating 2TM effector domain-containing protein n=1 Tax=Veillonella magna TaxID=464322 RepID=A0ABS2GDZ3_9FIRM|nr:hypothetical protein [Veillonella magna]MBM6823596.1 hypothetical protein [Veillonella magna]MBM6911940.1 hypothetical protein [Veillonella magna]